MAFHWILLLLLLVCSALVSGSETALFGLSQVQLRQFSASDRPLHRLVYRLMRRPRKVLMTLLITNTAINVLYFASSYILFESIAHVHPAMATLGGFVALLAVIAFGEILPKAVARAHATKFAPLAAPLIRTMQTALGPLLTVLQVVLIDPLTRLCRETSQESDDVTVDELRALVELSAHQGVIDSAENHMLQEIVALPDITVRSIMIPRVDILAVSIDQNPDEALLALRQDHLSKIPVYERNLDGIVGMIYARDLYLRPGATVSELTRTVLYVPEQIKLLQLITHFRQTHTKLAIVVDEFGGTAGLVTLRHVLESIVGDLGGCEEPSEQILEVIDENTYRLAGDLSIRDWAQRFGIVSNKTPGLGHRAGIETVAGLLLSELGRLPRKGDTVRIQNVSLTVERLDGRRISRILVTRDQNKPRTPSTSKQPEVNP